MRTARRALLCLPFLCGACRTPPSPAPELGEGEGWSRFEYARPKMGTTFRLVLYGRGPEGDRRAADRAAEAAFAEIDRLNAIYSDYDSESELSRLSRAAPRTAVALSTELAAVLTLAAEVSAASGGAFDVTVGPYVRLWRRARRQGELPHVERLAAAAHAVGYQKLALDARAGTATLGATGMRLDLGGIAKGATLDAVLVVLAERGFERALVDGGGDVAVAAPPPGRSAWRVGVEPAQDLRFELELAHASVATSGDRYRFLEIDGVRYSHLIDPATGLGLTRRVAATVVVHDGPARGARADALASALCVLGAGASGGLLERVAPGGSEARVVTFAQGPPRNWDSPGFERFLHAVGSANASR